MDGREEQNELFGMTQAWSRYNDYIYVITNQLLSLSYAHKYFGNNETREVLREVFKYLFNEINYLENLKNSSNSNINYIENKNNFNFQKIGQILEELLKRDNKSEEVQLEESKSTFSDLCPISRNPIIQPVTQKYCNSSSTCDHTFERNNILQFLKQKNNIDCPVIGCSKKISKAFLHKDLELSYFKKNRQFNGYFDSALITFNRNHRSEMVSSALNYANKLKRNDNKGPLGQVEFIDTNLQVHKKTNLLYELLLNSKNTIVHTGAGVSTGSGIPDFRGPTGIWTLMDGSSNEQSSKKKGKRRKLTDSECIPTKTTVSAISLDSTINKEDNSTSKEEQDDNCTITTTTTTKEQEDDSSLNKKDKKEEYVLYGNNKKKVVEFVLALPSETHLCLLELLDKKIIRHVITQNIDGLHSISGIKFNELSELHGNVFVQRCLGCARRFQRSYVAPTISFNTTGELCGLCTFPPFNLLTDVVLDWFDRYEKHFEDSSISHAREADLHLVLGSSLHIEPACHYVSNEYYRKVEAPLVIVNYQSTKLDSECDLIIHEDVNKVSNLLLKKLNLSPPVFLKKSYLIILKYQLSNNSCVLLLKLSTLNSFEVLLDSKLGPTFGETAAKGVQSVRHKCLNKLQGLYEFTFNCNFVLRLTLFYNTHVELEVPYERIVLFKGEIWELDICATNGSKVRISQRVFQSPNNQLNEQYQQVESNQSQKNKEKEDKKQQNKKEVDENNLICIRKMTISYNAHLIGARPFRMVGYLDLINRKNEAFGECGLPDSLIVLSYLWAQQCVQRVQGLKYDSNQIRDYFELLRNDLDFYFTNSNSSYNPPFTELSNSESFTHSNYSNKDNYSLNKDNLSSSLTKDNYPYNKDNYPYNKDNYPYNKDNYPYNTGVGEDILDSYYDQHISQTSSFVTNNDLSSNNPKQDNEDNSNANITSTTSTNNEDNSTTTTTTKDNSNTNNTTSTNEVKRKKEIWKEIFKCSKLVEVVVYRSIKLKLVRVKNGKIVPNAHKLSAQNFANSLKSSLPLKLYLLRSFRLGCLVQKVPEELVQSNRFGNYKHYSRIITNYCSSNSNNSVNKDDCNITNKDNNNNNTNNKQANLVELLVFNVIKKSLELANLEDYVATKLYYRHLPLWIVKYLSDLLECR